MRFVLLMCIPGVCWSATVPPSHAASLGGRLASASVGLPSPEPWGANASSHVLGFAADGDTLYVGGTFYGMGRIRGTFLAVDPESGEPFSAQAHVGGVVRAIVPDGGGGWYVAGDVTSVGGLPRSGLAHVLADGAPDAWAPAIDGTVSCLAVQGRTLYVGGTFNLVDGQPRNHLAAFNLNTRRLLAWHPDPNGAVLAIKPHRDRVFFAGLFTGVSGQARANAAAWDVAGDSLSRWAPQLDADVLCMEVTDSVVVLGGHFHSVSGVPRVLLSAVSTSDGALLPWNPKVDRLTPIFRDGGARVSVMYLRDSLLYFGGSFDHVNDVERKSLACVDLRTGQVTGWDAQAKWFFDFNLPQFFSFCANGNLLYVGGHFAEIGGRVRGGYTAALDLRTGVATTWDPRPDQRVWAIAADGSHVMLGGEFALAWSWAERRGIASFNLKTGEITSWNPSVNELVHRMYVHGRTLYVTGDFSQIDGQARSELAAFDLDTGALKPWNPSPDFGGVRAIVAEDSVVWVGGGFHVIGGVWHPFAAALDAETGAVLPWNPEPDDFVEALVRGRDAIYLGGIFTTLHGQHAQGLAAVSPDTSAALMWQAEADYGVFAMAVLDTTLYAGGWFGTLGGQPRVGLGAVSTRTGHPEPWRADLTSYAQNDLQAINIATTSSAVYVGGAFTGISGTSQARLAALDPHSAELLDWRPRIDPDREPWDVYTRGHSVYIGGTFTYVDAQPVGGFAMVPAVGVPLPPPAFPSTRLTVRQNTPNPAIDETAIRFSTPYLGLARVGLYDLQGRLLDSRELTLDASGGEHEVRFRTANLRPGCYLYRVQAGGETATRRMVVIR